MTDAATNPPFVAIACGGTGGHLFPGIAVAEELKKRGCKIALLISPKDVDQQAVKSAQGFEIFTLSAVGLQNRNYFSFGLSFWKSFCASRKIFKQRKPDAVLAMGGFTSAPPILAVKKFASKTFLHESNTISGRANRFLARFVDEAFIGFPETESRLRAKKISVTGTPVRPQFSQVCSSGRESAQNSGNQSGLTSAATIENCRTALGLDPNLPTILIVGGSQGASGLNEMILSALPLLADKKWQWLHLTGANDFEKVKAAYAAKSLKAIVKPFLAEMDLALGAATACVSRSGASSLAEIAAMRLPSLLVPFPAAADNHQYFNALAFDKTGAAKLLEQKNATSEEVAAILTELVENDLARSEIQNALAQWHAPRAAEQIAENILSAIARQQEEIAARKSSCGCGHAHGSAKHAP
ncbi:MAG TPA: undecaprenyldiphospho-muramoylpentapeptide beta-N-acetylglucosaminyltransferase [Methylomirabilota bacterium]|nr:undecaprenyldiphospho-muramoylpentapeptide beta-N-acetylglucosaminyltransferase [Methylomirabilota bacterium]